MSVAYQVEPRIPPPFVYVIVNLREWESCAGLVMGYVVVPLAEALVPVAGSNTQLHGPGFESLRTVVVVGPVTVTVLCTAVHCPLCDHALK